MGISPQAFYRWKRKYAGLGLSELRELRQLREENRKLKTLVADLTPDAEWFRRSEYRGKIATDPLMSPVSSAEPASGRPAPNAKGRADCQGN